MAPIRMKNRFGRRYIRLKELCDYAVDLDLCPQPPVKGFMEFLETEGLLTPVRRLQFPPEILRRFAQNRYEGVNIAGPVEPDGPRLDAAAELKQGLGRWSDARMYGESEHVLDALSDAHRPFLQTGFSIAQFTPWEDSRVHLYDTASGPIFSSAEQDTPAFYHYWQIFWLAAILRSGIHIWFPLDDEQIAREVRPARLPRSRPSAPRASSSSMTCFNPVGLRSKCPGSKSCLFEPSSNFQTRPQPLRDSSKDRLN